MFKFLVVALVAFLSFSKAQAIPPVGEGEGLFVENLRCVRYISPQEPRRPIPIQDCTTEDRIRFDIQVKSDHPDVVVHAVLLDEDGGIFARVHRPKYLKTGRSGLSKKVTVTMRVFGHFDGLHTTPPEALAFDIRVNDGTYGEFLAGEAVSIDFYP